MLFSTRTRSAGRIHRLTGRSARRWVSRTLVGVCAAALCLPLTLVSAQADPSSQAGEQVHVEWDGPTVSWDWNGRQQETEELTFVGSRVAVPGDHSQRTLNVRNDGPTDAVASVRVALPPAGPQAGGGFEDAIQLFWTFGGISDCRSWADLRPQSGALVGEVAVARGEVVSLTVGFFYSIDATAGRASEDLNDPLTFDVLVSLRQSTDVSPTPTPPAPPSPRPPASPHPSDQGSAPSAPVPPASIMTGAQVIDPASNRMWRAMLVIILLGSGSVAVVRSARAWRRVKTGGMPTSEYDGGRVPLGGDARPHLGH